MRAKSSMVDSSVIALIGLIGCQVPDASPPQCELPHATADQSDGMCRIGLCEEGFRDCDLDAVTGCEVDIRMDMAHCGQCDADCEIANAVSVCAGGTCQLLTCMEGFADCDVDEKTGCETNIKTSLQHCGSCDVVCSFDNASASCEGEKCVMGVCEDGWGDCDGSPATGCEINTKTSSQHCGSCDTPCEVENASATCENGQCAMDTCQNGWADCDADATTGCEQQLNTSEHCGACSRDCLGGPCEDAACAPLKLASNQSQARSITVNSTHVYWSTHAYAGVIRRVSKSGGLVQTLASGQAIPDGIALSATDVVWANDFDDRVRSVPLDGGPIKELATGVRPVGIAVTSTHAFWTNWTSGSVQRVPFTGGAPQDISTDGNDLPHRIVTNGAFVWWTNAGVNSNTGSVRRATVDGANVTTIAVGGNPVGLAVDDTHVCWSNQAPAPAPTISCMPVAGGAIDELAVAGSTPNGVAIDDTHVYWVEGYPSGSIRRTHRTTGVIETLATGQLGATYMALDTDSIYWANGDSGEIMRLAK